MATLFPGGIDPVTPVTPSPPGAETLATKPHSALHNDANEAIVALETYVGVTDGDPDDLTTRIANLEAAGGGGGGQWENYNFKAWNTDLNTVSSTEVTATSGTLYLNRLILPEAMTITNLHLMVNTAGTVTGAYGALYSSTGTLLSQSASIHGTWGTLLRTYPLGAAQAVAAGPVYLGFWTVHSVSPGFIKTNMATGVIVNAGLAAPNLRSCTSTTGLTTTAPNPFGAQTNGNNTYWVAVS